MWLSRPHLGAHGFPLCHDHIGSRDPAWVQSPVKVGLAIDNHNQLRSRPGQSSRNHSFGKHGRDVTVSERTKFYRQRIVNKVCYPRTPETWWLRQRVWRQSLPHCLPGFVPLRSRAREGRQCFKDNVYHFCPLLKVNNSAHILGCHSSEVYCAHS
jgi:hypothetical protein